MKSYVSWHFLLTSFIQASHLLNFFYNRISFNTAMHPKYVETLLQSLLQSFVFLFGGGIFIHVLHQQFTVWMLLLLHHHLMDRKCNLCASFGFFSIALCLGNKWTKRKAIKELDETVLRGAEKKQINNRNKANIIIIESHRYLTHIYNNTSYSMYS